MNFRRLQTVSLGILTSAFLSYFRCEKSSDFLAAKLYYKMLSYKFMNEDAEDDFESNFNDASSSSNKFSKYNDDDDF